MSKKPIIIVISVVLGLFLIGLVSYYFIIQRNNPNTDDSGGGFFSFFPFGGNEGNSEIPIREETPEEENANQENFTQKLRLLSSEPVAGAGVIDVKAGSLVRYIEKATGHVYEVEMFSPVKNRISNATVPVVYDALWSENNSHILAKYLEDDDKTIKVYGLAIKSFSTTTENTVSAVQFPPEISDASVFGNNVFYLQQTLDSSVGYTSSFEAGSKKQIWNSPIKELNPQYVRERTVALTTKPEQNAPGFLFFVDTSNGQVRTILRNISGLSTLVNNDATQVLYRGTSGLYLYEISNKTSKTITPETIPEKCVWSKKDKTIVYCAVPVQTLGGESLISWYKGIALFADEIWKYDLKNNTSNVVGGLIDEFGEYIDVIKPILSQNEQYLVFMNKTDNTLWSLDLTK